MRRAGRFNQTRDKVSFGPSSGSVVTDKSEVIHEFKSEARDTTGKLIEQVLFNYQKGNYVQHLIKTLRDYLKKYDPLTSKAALIRIVFSPTNKDNEAEANRLATYIDMYSVYLVGIGIKGVLFEFGRENRMPGPVKERQLPGSHLLGFDEGYGGSGMACLSSVDFGRNRLIIAIETICAAGYHMPITPEVCFDLRAHLTVITVMVCEGARFYPMSSYFSRLIKHKLEERLLKWHVVIINSWESMSKIHRGVTKPKPYSQVIPDRYNDLTPEIVEELRKDKRWVEKVLAIVCGAK